jgi:hypothetical protein
MRARGFTTKHFTTPQVLTAVDKGTRRALFQYGGYVRTVARRSMKPGKTPAPPGQPPRVHTGALKNAIVFAVDMTRRSVVIGPELASSRSNAPAALERGERSRLTTRRGQRMIRIQPRPYMAPAAAAGNARLPEFWSNTISR